MGVDSDEELGDVFCDPAGGSALEGWRVLSVLSVLAETTLSTLSLDSGDVDEEVDFLLSSSDLSSSSSSSESRSSVSGLKISKDFPVSPCLVAGAGVPPEKWTCSNTM